MEIDSDTLIFFDASCLIAGTYSTSGGSRFLLELCRQGYLKGVISQPVLVEAERNIEDKSGSKLLTTYHDLLESIPFINASVPPAGQRQFDPEIVEAKDIHVLAAVLSVDAQYLVTLDQALKNNIDQADISPEAYTPGGFIKQVLVDHIDYPELRNDMK